MTVTVVAEATTVCDNMHKGRPGRVLRPLQVALLILGSHLAPSTFKVRGGPVHSSEKRINQSTAELCSEAPVLCAQSQSTVCGMHRKKLLLDLREFVGYTDTKDRTRGLLWGGDPLCRQVREGTSAGHPDNLSAAFTFTGHRVRVRLWTSDLKVCSMVSPECGSIRKPLSLRLGAAVQQEAQAGCPGYRGPALETD